MKKALAFFSSIAVLASVLGGCSFGEKSSSKTEISIDTDGLVSYVSGTDKVEEDLTPLPGSYQIEGVEPILQTDLKAGCETYAATSLLRKLGFDLDEYVIADNYLDCHYITYGEGDTMYGPDMHSAFAGTAQAGWGVYAPSMAKSINSYLSDQKSKLKATAYKDVSFEDLLRKYIVKDIPVMVWATTDMQEPYVFDTWIVDYVDENAEAKIGDTVSWYMHEHCLVLIGYDEENYYFADSTHGSISSFERKLTEQRYADMGSQCIVIE